MIGPGQLRPTRTIDPIDTPPDSHTPTTAQLKADIDSGRTGDKVEVFDPGLSPLGTDDEAAGRPPEPHRIRLARLLEGGRRWMGGGRSKPGHAHHHERGFMAAYVTSLVLLGAIMVGGILLVRS